MYMCFRYTPLSSYLPSPPFLFLSIFFLASVSFLLCVTPPASASDTAVLPIHLLVVLCLACVIPGSGFFCVLVASGRSAIYLIVVIMIQMSE